MPSPHGEYTLQNPCTTFDRTTHAQFQANTGLILGMRTLASGDAIGPSDVLANYTYDQRGFLASEKYSGADKQSLSGLGEFTPASSPAYYEIDYTPLYDGGNRLTGRTGVYAQAGLSIANETYDPGTGLTLSSTDASGITTQYTYDLRGRRTRESTPGHADTTYDYTDASVAGTFTPAAVTVSQQSTTAGLARQVYDYDGFGHLTHERILQPDNTWSVRETLYTPTGRYQKVSEFDATPTHYTIFAGFDAFDHATRITAPDGHLTTISYGYDSTAPDGPGDPYKPGVRRRTETKQIKSDANGAETPAAFTELYGAAGRIQQVIEPAAGTQATYSYGVGGELTNVVLSDGQNLQRRVFSYDSLGFLRSEQHPELGAVTTTYSDYDARGHVGKKTVADPAGDCNPQAYRCFDLSYTYDKAERLTAVDSRNPYDPAEFRPLKEFSYATSNDGMNRKQGKLETATRHNYQPALGDITVTETYEYRDAAGRLTTKTTDVACALTSIEKTLRQSYSYNDLGQPSTITYPTCYDTAGCGETTWGSIQPAYSNGRLTSMTAPDFATSITYWPNGMVKAVMHPPGVTDTYDIYDSAGSTTGMARPTAVTFGNWTACGAPVITQQPAPGAVAPYYYGDAQTLTVGAVGTTPAYQWYQGQVGDTTTPVGTTTQYTTPPLTQTVTYWVRITNTCGRADSSPATVNVTLRAAQGLTATRTASTTIDLAWQPVQGATSYNVLRRSGASFTPVGTTSSLSLADTVPLGSSFFYQVTASAANVTTSAPSNTALASSLTFMAITGGMDVTFAQFDELRGGVNAVRAAWGDPPLSWSDLMNGNANPCAYPAVAELASINSTIYASHLMRLRCAMDNALGRGGIPHGGYANADVTNADIRASDITELQQRTGAGQ